ncbi:hypothetical protein DdX_09255 [Ditylenchus destructor]|uniref:Uncharacterized protein n=1 Tax=Ditylenchus destructor TaxID=166010 RepID=A0AAD4R6Q5_9BILA|nr:hypothetical protein DdX_09255 [Ditylenchus destructor]
MQKSTASLIFCLCIISEANLIQNKDQAFKATAVKNDTAIDDDPDNDDKHNCRPICKFLNLEDLQRKYGIGFGIGWSKYGNTTRSFGICICDGEIDKSGTSNKRKCLKALMCD